MRPIVGIRRFLVLASVCAMLLIGFSGLSGPVKADGPITIGLGDHIYVKSASGGEAGKDWWRLPERDTFGYAQGSMWAYAKGEAGAIGGVQIYAGVYQEIHFQSSAAGTYTATMTGKYMGRVAYPGAVPFQGMAKLYWSFRVIDLNNVRPNYIVAEKQVSAIQRDYLGSQTVSKAFTATLTWNMPTGDISGARYGLEAYVQAYAETWNR